MTWALVTVGSETGRLVPAAPDELVFVTMTARDGSVVPLTLVFDEQERQ